MRELMLPRSTEATSTVSDVWERDRRKLERIQMRLLFATTRRFLVRAVFFATVVTNTPTVTGMHNYPIRDHPLSPFLTETKTKQQASILPFFTLHTTHDDKGSTHNTNTERPRTSRLPPFPHRPIHYTFWYRADHGLLW